MWPLERMKKMNMYYVMHFKVSCLNKEQNKVYVLPSFAV